MPLQFRRGAEADLPAAGDAAVGEPLFTTDSGKLYIKKANGTFAEIGDGSDIDLSGLATGSLVQVNATQDGFDAATQIPSAVTFVTTDESGFSAAVGARLLEDLPSTSGVLDIAKQSTLQDFIADFPVDGNGNLDIARQTTLESFDATVTSVQSGLSNLQYLPTFFTNAALPSISPTSTGFLQYDATLSAWSLVTSTATAPTEINGGNASSFSE